ncbi:hypothetical protein ACWCOV_33435 [Kribbella sp. NPDC002412]
MPTQRSTGGVPQSVGAARGGRLGLPGDAAASALSFQVPKATTGWSKDAVK